VPVPAGELLSLAHTHAELMALVRELAQRDGCSPVGTAAMGLCNHLAERMRTLLDTVPGSTR